MNDESIMTFGSHKGKRLIDIPDSYLIWFWGENKERFKSGRLWAAGHNLMEYIEDSFTDLP